MFVVLFFLTVGVTAIIGQLLGYDNIRLPTIEEPITLVLLLASLAYQLAFGRSPGKQFSKIRIVRIRGGRPAPLILGLRWLFQWLPSVVALLIPELGRLTGWRHGFLYSLSLPFMAFWLVDALWALTNRKRSDTPRPDLRHLGARGPGVRMNSTVR